MLKLGDGKAAVIDVRQLLHRSQLEGHCYSHGTEWRTILVALQAPATFVTTEKTHTEKNKHPLPIY